MNWLPHEWATKIATKPNAPAVWEAWMGGNVIDKGEARTYREASRAAKRALRLWAYRAFRPNPDNTTPHSVYVVPGKSGHGNETWYALCGGNCAPQEWIDACPHCEARIKALKKELNIGGCP